MIYFKWQPFGINDTIGCYLDLDNGSVKFSKNGKLKLDSYKTIIIIIINNDFILMGLDMTDCIFTSQMKLRSTYWSIVSNTL